MYEIAVNSAGVPVELANVAILVPGYTGTSEIGFRFIIKKRNLLVGNYEATDLPIIKGESIWLHYLIYMSLQIKKSLIM